MSRAVTKGGISRLQAMKQHGRGGCEHRREWWAYHCVLVPHDPGLAHYNLFTVSVEYHSTLHIGPMTILSLPAAVCLPTV